MKRDQYDKVMDRMTIAIGVAIVLMVIWFNYFTECL